ncbi:MAG: SufE family protein [Gammaproteobacteria bacterium]|nr:SufE family protein [Gammaproteobacteria bacterium]
MDRYQYLIDLGRKLPDLADDEKTEKNRIRSCQSQVWFVAKHDGSRLRFRAISDAAIVSGLIALLLRIYSDKPAADILATKPDFVSALELEQHLSPTRSNGLASMLNAIRQFAADAQQTA